MARTELPLSKLSKLADHYPCAELITVPTPWRNDPHLIAVGWPWAVGAEDLVEWTIEDRVGVGVGRFCEANEIDLARECAGSMREWFAEVGVMLYDPTSKTYGVVA